METNTIETTALENIATHTVNGREVISQTQAAKLRKISRQRVNQLVATNRLSVPVSASGEPVRGGVYLDEVMALTAGKRGRPRLTDEEKASRGLDEYREGDVVRWKHYPRDGFGFSMEMTGRVVKAGVKKVKVAFRDSEGVEHFSWVYRDLCKVEMRPGDGGEVSF